jgi:hypothetical protein
MEKRDKRFVEQILLVNKVNWEQRRFFKESLGVCFGKMVFKVENFYHVEMNGKNFCGNLSLLLKTACTIK